MTESPLDGEISATVELTETGAKGAIKSRMANALDWAAGTWIVSKFQKRSLDSDERTAINDARLAFIRESKEIALGKIRDDPDILAPFIKSQFGIDIQKSENRAAAVGYMIEDIKASPPTDKESADGPDTISPDILNRWGRYAEDASSEELRERWGRVLSSEIRRPGLLSPKLLRVIDEINTDTANLFDRLAKLSLDGSIPACLVPKLEFSERTLLVQADLIVDPGVGGHIRHVNKTTSPRGVIYNIFKFNKFALAWDEAIQAELGDKNDALTKSSKGVCIPIIVLTEVGKSLALVAGPNEEENFISLCEKVSDKLPKGKLLMFAEVDGDFKPVVVDGIEPPDSSFF